MATEREEIRYEGGRGGKFQKRSGRRPHATPYDRPPTALRNSTTNGWLSKLVDPAQKLITSGARLFFSSFQKRLPPPPPSLPLPPEANDEMEYKNPEAVATDAPGTQGAPNLDVAPSIDSNTHGVTELEEILKEKTFTRSEIDRLTELLNSRVVDASSRGEERKSELIPSTPIVSHGMKEESLNIPSQGGVGTPIVSARVASPNVFEEDVASPAEIAKAYMGSRPSKATPSIMASHSQTLVDSLAVSSNPSKSPFMSLVPRSSGNVDVIENGFVTPRSRGRSALYSMARLPYSRVRATPSIKNTLAITDAYRATSSPSLQSACEQGRLLGSKEGALKRRSFVLDEEMGSVGSSRRIRQKSNLLFPKGSSLPISGSSTSISVSGIGSETTQHLQSMKVPQFTSSAGKSLYPSESKRNLSKLSTEYKHDAKPTSSFPPIPFRSSEMASKILEQLDKLTPPKGKSSELKGPAMRNNSPMMLSPSMLHWPALRSLEDVDSSKYLENVQDTRLNDARDFTSQKNEKVEEGSSLKLKVPNNISISTGDGVGSTVLTKDSISSFGVPVSSSQTKWAFQMSAHEDFVDLDEDGHSNGVATDILAEKREKVNGPFVEKKPSDDITAGNPQASIEVKSPIDSGMNQIADPQKSDISVTIERSTGFTFPTAPPPSTSINSIGSESALRCDKIVSSEVPNATAPLFGFGDKLQSQKELVAPVPTFLFGDKNSPANDQNAVPIVTSGDNVTLTPTQLATIPTTFNFGDKVSFPIPANAATTFSFGDKVPFPNPANAAMENGNKNPVSEFKFASSLVNEKESAKVGTASVFKAESSSSIPSFAVSKEIISDKADNMNSGAVLKVGTSENVFASSSISTSTSTPSLFTFGSHSINSSLNNGSLASTPSFFPSPTSTLSNNIAHQYSSTKLSLAAATSSSEPFTTSSLSTSAPTPSFPAAPIFKFGSSMVSSTSASPVSAPTRVEPIETKTNQETTLGNLSGISPSETPAKTSTTGSSVFQFGAAPTAASDADKQSESLTFSPGNVFTFSSPASSGVAASTQSMPIFSSSSTSFGLAGNTGLSSGSSPFGSSAPASNLFNSGSSFGLGSSSSSSQANSFSSSAGTISSFTWQPSTTSSFSTAFNSSSSTGFSFGLTSSTAASNSSPMLFGSSTSGPTSSVFSFTSAAATALSQPIFGNSNQAFAFGSTASANNDQLSMVDSMAEDTVQAVVPTPVFGQQPLSPPPSSGFVFGSTAPVAASPFQFGSQQSVPTPQNLSPFQASGSLDFNASAGGNFSLGAGGGDKSNRKYVKVKSKARKK